MAPRSVGGKWVTSLKSAEYTGNNTNCATRDPFRISMGSGRVLSASMKISPPFPHVKRKPFMPGWERDRECRDSDRNYGHADPLDQMVLLQLMHRLTEITGDKHYAREADKSAEWWMAHCQTPNELNTEINPSSFP